MSIAAGVLITSGMSPNDAVRIVSAARGVTVPDRRTVGMDPQAGRGTTDSRIEWQPSREDRRAHPELPADAVVRGRLMVAHIEGENGKRRISSWIFDL